MTHYCTRNMQGLWWRVEVVRDGHERPRIENDCPKMRASAFPEATAHLPTTTHEQAGMAAKTQHTNHQHHKLDQQHQAIHAQGEDAHRTFPNWHSHQSHTAATHPVKTLLKQA